MQDWYFARERRKERDDAANVNTHTHTSERRRNTGAELDKCVSSCIHTHTHTVHTAHRTQKIRLHSAFLTSFTEPAVAMYTKVGPPEHIYIAHWTFVHERRGEK